MFYNRSGYDACLFIKELRKKFKKYLSHCKENFIRFNIKINFKLARVTNKDSEGVNKNIQFRFVDNCRFMASILDKLASNLDDHQCKKLKSFTRETKFLSLPDAKVYICISTWTVGKNLKRQRYPQRIYFTEG